jgi:hypothetical protein
MNAIGEQAQCGCRVGKLFADSSGDTENPIRTSLQQHRNCRRWLTRRERNSGRAPQPAGERQTVWGELAGEVESLQVSVVSGGVLP